MQCTSIPSHRRQKYPQPVHAFWISAENKCWLAMPHLATLDLNTDCILFFYLMVKFITYIKGIKLSGQPCDCGIKHPIQGEVLSIQFMLSHCKLTICTGLKADYLLTFKNNIESTRYCMYLPVHELPDFAVIFKNPLFSKTNTLK